MNARLRFGVLLALCTLGGVQLADVAVADPFAPTRTDTVLAGEIRTNSYQLVGRGGSVGSVVFERTNLCAPCSITVAILESGLAVGGDGAAGILPPGKVYTIAGFVGTWSVARVAAGDYVVALEGAAEAIREQPPDWQ